MTPTIDNRCDRPFKDPSAASLSDGVLNAVFTTGSLWDYGPFVEGEQPTVVRVLPQGAYTSSVGRFIRCEVVYSPHGQRPGHEDGYPAHRLAPHLGCGTCCSCEAFRPCYNLTPGVVQSQRAEIEGLHETIAELNSTITRLEGMLTKRDWTIERLEGACMKAHEREDRDAGRIAGLEFLLSDSRKCNIEQGRQITRLTDQLRAEHQNANEEMLAMQRVIDHWRARASN